MNSIKHWHRKVVRSIALAFGLPEDLSHHHRAHVRHRHANQAIHHPRNQRVANWHVRHNQNVAEWHTRHTAEVMSATDWLGKWERFVYKQIRRFAR
ncbi:hypothetical protein RE628_02985 [Paenibacillus sp. D2_2]|uniref:hypothetical protein n=1 Tax=Paenibacillus sp. D2_2 TaxID=3073092 RepID=UPI0028162B46|nr:hypothetical protein [Paenibacillus sp. D2_2]WMT41523.1 hypothetical protein RE628_02985 [Paenibacillus sp. D2_2]